MAHEEHLALLRQGVRAWNEWRDSNPGLRPDLTEARLPGADLCQMNLAKANLARADLRGARLCEANLQGAQLRWTILAEAHLQYADLTAATGLLAGQLAGADVSGAQLPEEIRSFPELTLVEQLSQGLQSLFLVLLSACVYCILTLATTTHARLLTNATSSPLPIIGTVIPIASFYMAAPLLLLGLYVYLQLYYLRPLWEMLADLPARFPDGRPVEQKASLWLLIGLDRAPLARATAEGSGRLSLQSPMPGILPWAIVPVTLFLFWIEYLPRHDLKGTLLHSVVFVLSLWDFILLSWVAATPLRRAEDGPLWSGKKALLGATLSMGIFTLLSVGAIYGRPSAFRTDGAASFHSPLATAQLEEENISTKPPNWAVQYEKEEDMAKAIEAVQGAQLEDHNLRGANARRAFLAKANLRGADLRDADLFMVQLQGANLSAAQLQHANLSWAWLQRADLSEAHLEGANLQGAFLAQGARLANAYLNGANLQGAHLEGANLQGAHLEGAHLKGANLRGAKLEGAHLQNAHLEQADLQNASLAGANLSGARLQGALLSEVHRQGATMHGTTVQEAIRSASLLQQAGP